MEKLLLQMLHLNYLSILCLYLALVYLYLNSKTNNLAKWKNNLY